MTTGQICRLLVSGGGSAELRHAVAATYTVWSSAPEILRKLFQLYSMPSGSDATPEEVTAHGNKVIRTIVWFVVLGNGPRELIHGLVSRFAARVFDSGKSKNASELRQALARSAAMESEFVQKTRSWEDPQVPKNIFSPNLTLSDVPVVEVARQMTLMDFGLLSKVSPAELLSLGWLSSDERRQQSSVHVLELLQRFKVIESWVAGSILEEQRGDPSRVLSYFVSLAKCLFEMNSFQSCAAIWGGISNDAVWRLKPAFQALPPEQKAFVGQLEVSLSSWRGYSAYKRQFLEIVSTSLSTPVVPFLLPHLQAIAVASHAAPTYVAPGVVNVHKFLTLFRLLADLRLGAQVRFPFLVVVQIQNFLQTNKLSFFLNEINV